LKAGKQKMTPKPLGGLLTPVVAYRLRDNNSLTIFLRSLIGLGGELFPGCSHCFVARGQQFEPNPSGIARELFPGK